MKRRIAAGLTAVCLTGGVVIGMPGAAFAEHGGSHGRGPGTCEPPGTVVRTFAMDGGLHIGQSEMDLTPGRQISDECAPGGGAG